MRQEEIKDDYIIDEAMYLCRNYLLSIPMRHHVQLFLNKIDFGKKERESYESIQSRNWIWTQTPVDGRFTAKLYYYYDSCTIYMQGCIDALLKALSFSQETALDFEYVNDEEYGKSLINHKNMERVVNQLRFVQPTYCSQHRDAMHKRFLDSDKVEWWYRNDREALKFLSYVLRELSCGMLQRVSLYFCRNNNNHIICDQENLLTIPERPSDTDTMIVMFLLGEYLDNKYSPCFRVRVKSFLYSSGVTKEDMQIEQKRRLLCD